MSFWKKYGIIFEKSEMIYHHIKYLPFVHNFIDITRERQSPVMIEVITDHLWNWTDF